MERDQYGYIVVRYICPNAPGPTFYKRDHDGHTYSRYSYGNGAGARWGEHLRPKVCSKCGERLISGDEWKHRQEV